MKVILILRKNRTVRVLSHKKGDRIAQIVLQKVPRIQFVEKESVADIGKDRGGGFGSTGVR